MADDRRRAEAEAARLRDQIRAALMTWLEERGISAEVGISGFVSPGGQPKVLFNLDARVAARMIAGITGDKPEPGAPPPPQMPPPPPPPPWAPEHPGWSVPPQGPPPHHSPPPPQGYRPDQWRGDGEWPQH